VCVCVYVCVYVCVRVCVYVWIEVMMMARRYLMRAALTKEEDQ